MTVALLTVTLLTGSFSLINAVQVVRADESTILRTLCNEYTSRL